MSAFMSDRTPEEQRYARLQMLVYDILRAEDGGRLVAPRSVDDFVDKIIALDAAPSTPDVERPARTEAETAGRLKELERALQGARTVIIGLATPLSGGMSPATAARLDEWALLLKGPMPLPGAPK